ncbi:MAG TPA: hypothetical protein VN436_13620 [Holophaga sp.]|nr:hypothetical protein [Holophaga sp.]
MRDRRQFYVGMSYHERRKQLWPRREHTCILRILWIPLDRLVFEWRTVSLF